MSLLLVALIPLGFSFFKEQQLCRIYYFRAIATQIVDGEMEVLAAGGWRSQVEGSRVYQVQAEAAKNLPPGKFVLTRGTNQIRLEWIPDKSRQGGRVVREVKVP
jgi:hypothetical protein